MFVWRWLCPPLSASSSKLISSSLDVTQPLLSLDDCDYIDIEDPEIDDKTDDRYHTKEVLNKKLKLMQNDDPTSTQVKTVIQKMIETLNENELINNVSIPSSDVALAKTAQVNNEKLKARFKLVQQLFENDNNNNNHESSTFIAAPPPLTTKELIHKQQPSSLGESQTINDEIAAETTS